MTCTFSAEQITALSAPLDRAKVRQREQGRSSVSYLEGWQAIAEANRIFGFDGWQRQTLQLRCIHQGERTIGRDHRPGWGLTYTARVRITIGEGSGAQLIREGCGAGHGIDVDLGQAHESALKEAETDAMKRALMTFGNPSGILLSWRSTTSSSGRSAVQPRQRQLSRADVFQPRLATNPSCAASRDAGRTAARLRGMGSSRQSSRQRQHPSRPIRSTRPWCPSSRPPSSSCTTPSVPCRVRCWRA
jgi:recombination DNA repair RAD52 pathway protein